MTDHQLIGKIGRVIGTIEPGALGEVMIPIRGGSEAYYAYADSTEERIQTGVRVVVVEVDASPRTVIVGRLS